MSTSEIPESYYSIDQFPECVALEQQGQLLEAVGVKNPYFKVHERVIDDTTVINGRELISWASYNYLGMSGDPAVKAAAKEAIDRYGTSVSASRLVSGEENNPSQIGTGHLQPPGRRRRHYIRLWAFDQRNDDRPHVWSRRFNPARLGWPTTVLFKAAFLAAPAVDRFPTTDWETLDQLLGELRHEYRRVLIAIEGIYSMDGDYPDHAALYRSQKTP